MTARDSIPDEAGQDVQIEVSHATPCAVPALANDQPDAQHKSGNALQSPHIYTCNSQNQGNTSTKIWATI